jgi:hypothetical protein
MPHSLACRLLNLAMSCAVVTATCAADDAAKPASTTLRVHAEGAPKMGEGVRISLYRLLGNAAAFDQKLIVVQGALSIGFKKQFLFPSFESADNLRYMDGVWLNFSKLPPKDQEALSHFTRGEATVLGTYHKESEAPYRWSEGTILVESLTVREPKGQPVK